MGNTGVRDAIHQLFEGATEHQIRAIGVKSLRQWRLQGSRPERFVALPDPFGTAFITLLADDRSIPMDANAVAMARNEIFISGGEQLAPVRNMVADFIWWLIRAGLARPGNYNATTDILQAIWMSEAGLRLLDAVDDHPLLPGFLSRLHGRYPDIPVEIVRQFEDAQSCLEVNLLRPAVVLLGVAFEAAVEDVLDKLAAKKVLEPQEVEKASKAGQRIGLLRKPLKSLVLKPDQQRGIEATIAFADHLRARRNDGAHTTLGFPFDDHNELEQLFVSGARHLPLLWEMTKAPMRAGG